MNTAQWVNDQITEMVRENNGEGLFREPLVGFSSADDPLYATVKDVASPKHLFPQEVLPEVKTVISFFIPFSEQVVKTNRAAWPEVAKEWVLSYHSCNRLIDQVSDHLVQAFRAKGVQAETVISTGSFDRELMVATWSHRTSAYIAGLGSWGLNRLLITEKGCAGRYGTVFVSEEIPPTVRSGKENCLYFAKGACRYCVEKCPVNALNLDKGQDMKRRICMEQCETPSPYRPGNANADCCGKCSVGPCAYWE